MPRAEQERVARAIMKMRENEVDEATGRAVPGSSQYFRLAVIHDGMPPLSEHEYPEYCSHRRECFPNWHRPYLLDFERTMRRAGTPSPLEPETVLHAACSPLVLRAAALLSEAIWIGGWW